MYAPEAPIKMVVRRVGGSNCNLLSRNDLPSFHRIELEPVAGLAKPRKCTPYGADSTIDRLLAALCHSERGTRCKGAICRTGWDSDSVDKP